MASVLFTIGGAVINALIFCLVNLKIMVKKNAKSTI